MVPYLEWQTDAAYKADPPADYFYPGYDLFAELAKIRTNLVNDVYDSEYAFQLAMYKDVFGPGHDGHYVYYSDLLTAVFDNNRRRSLVSLSEDGSSLPVIKLYEDVIASPETASAVVLINGVDAATYVADTIFTAGFNQDADSAYNTMFYEMAFPPSGTGNGYFSSGGRIRYIYDVYGPETTFTFANGTEATFENYARIKTSLSSVTDGPSFYQKFCTGATSDEVVASAGKVAVDGDSGITVPGYPTPVVITEDGVVSCYFLDGEGFEDVAVIALLAFENESPAEFQEVCQQCFAKAVEAGKTKLVVDFQANGGGYILQGYDFFRQLFPHVVQDGFSRWKENGGFMAISEIVSDLVADVNPYTSDDYDLIGFYESWFNYRYDLNISDLPFQTFEDKFAPHVYKHTNYTAIMRWNLNDNLTTTNETFGMGMEIAGYGSLSDIAQPFEAENIIMLYDGMCASTCTLASEMLRIQGGVKSIAMGGRPKQGPIQGVGGVKGAQVLNWSNIFSYAQWALQFATTDAQKDALSAYTDLPLRRSTAAAVNTRDQILRDNVNDGLPAQFVAEEADCRLYWTAPMVTDVTEVWKAAADAAFNGAKCAAGGIEKRDVSEKAEARRRNYLSPAGVEERSKLVAKRNLAPREAATFNAKNLQKAIP